MEWKGWGEGAEGSGRGGSSGGGGRNSIQVLGAWVSKDARSRSSNQLVRLLKVMVWCTAQCKMLLFCLKTIIKESPCFELAHLKKKVKKKERKKSILAV